MFHRNSMKFYLILLSLVCLLSATGLANVDPLPSQFDVVVVTDPSPIKAGTATLKVIVTPRDVCSQISLEGFKTDNLDYRGGATIISSVLKSNTAEFSLPIDIIANELH